MVNHLMTAGMCLAIAATTSIPSVLAEAGGLFRARGASLVVSVNAAPRATADILIMRGGDERAIDVVGNDTDPNGDALTLVTASPGEHGATTISANGIIYRPAAGYEGADRFTYIVSDPDGGTSTGTVLVVVLPARPQAAQ
jgi:large repetitive protein